MAESKLSITGSYIPTRTSDPTYGMSTKVVNAFVYGNVIVVSYYIVITVEKHKNDIIVAFDLPQNFKDNIFDGNLCFRKDTKILDVDRTISPGAISGLIVGIFG